jgi:hypothetical protein
MPSSGILRRVALVRTDVSEERSASFIRVTRIGELGTTLAVTSNRRTIRRNIYPPCMNPSRRSEQFLAVCCCSICRARAVRCIHPPSSFLRINFIHFRVSSTSADLHLEHGNIRGQFCCLMSTSGGRSVGIVRSRTKGHGVCFFCFVLMLITQEN